MFGKLLSHLLGNTDEDFEGADNTCEELMEFEEGGWVIVNLPGERKTQLFIALFIYDSGFLS